MGSYYCCIWSLLFNLYGSLLVVNVCFSRQILWPLVFLSFGEYVILWMFERHFLNGLRGIPSLFYFFFFLWKISLCLAKKYIMNVGETTMEVQIFWPLNFVDWIFLLCFYFSTPPPYNVVGMIISFVDNLLSLCECWGHSSIWKVDHGFACSHVLSSL